MAKNEELIFTTDYLTL